MKINGAFIMLLFLTISDTYKNGLNYLIVPCKRCDGSLKCQSGQSSKLFDFLFFLFFYHYFFNL